MVDKMHRDWKWRVGISLAVALSTVAAWFGMAAVMLFGFFSNCGWEWTPDEGSPRAQVCDSAVAGATTWSVAGLAALAIAALGTAWVVRGRGGVRFAWAIAAGLALSVAVQLAYSAFPAS